MQNFAVFTYAEVKYYAEDEVKEYSEIIKKAHEDEKEIGCCENIKDYEVRQCFVDFGDLKF